MKLAFSLNKPKAADPPSLKRPAPFGSFDDDDTVDAAPTVTASGDKKAAPNAKLLSQNVTTSKTMQKRMEAEMKVDATVYEYDEVWDEMQEAKQKKKEVKEAEARERKVCPHMSSCLSVIYKVK
jgi:coiled-coil domain-containing protein 55